jgi:flagella basal body P-ring formation protein FlgA
MTEERKIKERAMADRLNMTCWFKAVVLTAIIVSFCLQPHAFASSWSPSDILKTFLLENYPWEEVDVSNVILNGDAGSVAPEKIFVEKGPVGRAVFLLAFRNGRNVIAKANVRVFDYVVKSKRPFKKGHVLGKDDIYLSKMDIRKMPNSSVKDPELLLGKSLKRSISANIPIVNNMIEMSKVVKRGSRVVLMIDHGGLSIKAAGKVKEKGYVGMAVRAVNLSSKKEVVGVLIDESTVKVEL